MLNLDPIKERAAKATAGPWQWMWHDESLQSLTGPCEIENHVLAVSPCESCQPCAIETAKAGKSVCLNGSPADQAFIAAARTDIPALLAEVEALRAAQTWQPIETAPEDEIVLVADEEDAIFRAILEKGQWIDVECDQLVRNGLLQARRWSMIGPSPSRLSWHGDKPLGDLSLCPITHSRILLTSAPFSDGFGLLPCF